MVRPRDVVLGVAGAVVVLIGPAPADIAALFQHPAAPCVSACGQTNAWWDQPVLVGQTNAWWDQPVLVAHADELPPAVPPAAPHRGGH